MVTTANDPEKTVSDDHRRQPRGRGHRDDGQEEEIQQADNDTNEEEGDEKASPEGRIQPTKFLSSLKSNGWRLTEFAKSLLLGARRKRAT